MTKQYPEYYQELSGLVGELREGLPGPMGRFGQLHRQTTQDGALSTRVKELMALAIAVAVRCDGCIVYHVHDALEAGATREEIAEAIGVAVLMGGGPAVMYGAEALAAVGQFETADVS